MDQIEREEQRQRLARKFGLCEARDEGSSRNASLCLEMGREEDCQEIIQAVVPINS